MKKNIIRASVWKQNDYWVGETDAILINSNCPELQGYPVEFCDNSKEGVVAQIISCLKAKGLSGKLRVN